MLVRLLAFAVMMSCCRVSFAQLNKTPAPGKYLKPDETAKAMVLPEGFRAQVFAGEPDVVQPIAYAQDERGRLWVIENLSYPNWKKEGNDRVIIL